MKIKTSIWSPKKWVIVYFHVANEQVEIQAMVCSKKDTTEPSCIEFDSFEEVVKKFGKNIAYCFHVTGAGVLSRKIDYLPGYKEQLIVNGDKDDFYFTSYHDQSSIVVSFFRKSLLERYIEIGNELKISLQSISSGIIPIFNLVGLNEKITLDHSIIIKEGKVLTFERVEEVSKTTSIANQYYSKLNAISTGIISSVSTPVENYEQAIASNDVAKQMDEFLQFNKFKFWGVFSLFFILSLLVANYIYMANVNNKVAQLELDLSIDNDKLTLLDRVRQEKTRKELLVSSSGVDTKQFISFYIDEIADSKPKGIKFKTMDVYPLEKPLKVKRKVEINQSKIEIIGSTPSSFILENWMDKLNRFEWVKSVELLNYLKSNQEASFKLLIQINK